MPVYEYRCEKCEFEFEREQRITDDPIKTCPECRSRRVKKLISQTSFVLKGGGWYNDLYSSTKKSEKSSSDSDSSSEPKKDGKKDSTDKDSTGGSGKKKSKKKSSKSAA